MVAPVLANKLELHAPLIREATRGLSEEQWRWRATPEAWSILEVIGHMLDEEQSDFRARIRMIFAGEKQWAPIDPEVWVKVKGHQDRVPKEILEELFEERTRSVQWLGELDGVDWNASMTHESLGALRAGDLLASWVAHDLLHVSQILKIRVLLTRRCAAPWSTQYAAP